MEKEIEAKDYNPFVCPYCGTEEIQSSNTIHTDLTTIVVENDCLECHKEWEENFKLVSAVVDV